jgi:hypothetical protein
MAAKNNVFKTVSADPFSFLFLFSRSLSLLRRCSQPPTSPRCSSPPAPRRRAAPSPASRSAPTRGTRARPSGRRRSPEPPSIVVQSPTLPPSTAAVQLTPPSSPFKARIVRYYFCVIYSIFSATVV